jgi:hypothetical protein
MNVVPIAATPAWRVVAASATGRRHRQHQQPCQDAVRWVATAGGLLLTAVADGAGSAPCGEAGAKTAVTAALAALEAVAGASATLDSDTRASTLVRSAIDAALEALREAAALRKAPLGEYATTLLVCVAGTDGVAAGQIGDGAVLVGSGRDRLEALTQPAAGEYLNETVFLTSEGALERLQTTFWTGRAQHVVLFSDGLQMLALKMPGAVPHLPFFQPLLGWLGRLDDLEAGQRELEATLRSARFSERTDDDLTLLLAERRE